MTVENALAGIAEGLLKTCADVSAVLAQLFKNAKDKGISFSLLSRYGPLLGVPGPATNRIRAFSTDPLLTVLRENFEHEERVVALFGDNEWELASRFSVAEMNFYPLITLPAPPKDLRWIRYELLAALDCFGLQSKKALAAFIDELFARDQRAPANGAKQGTTEKRIIEGLSGYSRRIDCVALIDEDGFVVLAAGREEKAEEIAGNLALFRRHAMLELQNMGEVLVTSLSLYNDDTAVLIGRTPEKKLSLALAVNGAYPSVLARFLFDIGYRALNTLAGTSGTLFESRREQETGPTRIRDSWFRPPRLVPRGNYVYRAGDTTFHTPECGSLTMIGDAELRWLATRGDAIRAGLTPCSLCRP